MPTNRIDATFAQLKKNKRKAFVAYLTAGYPNVTTTEKLVLALEKAGADIIELGVPFSDPMADGPTIQASSQAALDKGISLAKIFAMVKRIRKVSTVPIALMTYYNPIFHYGEKAFVTKCKAVGVDGLVVPDLPPEEATTLIQMAKAQDVSMVFFMAPTSRPTRMKAIAQASTGFIYYVSIAGVTGARTALPSSIASKLRLAKELTDKPICVGFGVSTPEQVKTITRHADGVIVGSAIIKEITKHMGKKNCVAYVAKFVRSLTKVLA